MSVLRKAGLALALMVAPVAALAQATTMDGVVAAARADVGRDIGGGVTLTAVQLEGAELRFGFAYVATVAQIEALGRQAFEDGFVGGMAAALCSNPPVPPFLAAGGSLVVTMVDPDGQQILGRRVTSC